MLSFPLRANSRHLFDEIVGASWPAFCSATEGSKALDFYGRQTGPSVFDFYADHYDCLCRSQPDKARKAITDSGANSGCIRVNLGRPPAKKLAALLHHVRRGCRGQHRPLCRLGNRDTKRFGKATIAPVIHV